MLRRMVAVLVSLAVLADRAADRSWPVRLVVLWLLRRAETAVHGFVLDETGMPVVFEHVASTGRGPDDALHLAERLRALAAALSALLPDAHAFAPRSARAGVGLGLAALAVFRATAGPAHRPIDSS